MKNIIYHIYKYIIINIYLIFFQNTKYDNLAWLRSNNIIISRIFLLHKCSYIFLKFSNLINNYYLVFGNLKINKINYILDSLNIYKKLVVLKFKIFWK